MAIFCYVYYSNYVSPATTGVSAVMSAALKLPPLQQVRRGAGAGAGAVGGAARRREGRRQRGGSPGSPAAALQLPCGKRVPRAGRLLWGHGGRGPHPWLAALARVRSPLQRSLPSPLPRCPDCRPPVLQLELLERLSNVLVGHEMLPARLGGAIADHAGRALAGGG